MLIDPAIRHMFKQDFSWSNIYMRVNYNHWLTIIQLRDIIRYFYWFHHKINVIVKVRPLGLLDFYSLDSFIHTRNYHVNIFWKTNRYIFYININFLTTFHNLKVYLLAHLRLLCANLLPTMTSNIANDL